MCPTLVETLSSETAEKQRFGLIFTFEFRKIKFPDIWRDSHEIEKGKIIHALLGWEAEEKSGTEGPNNVDHDQKEYFSSTWLISRRCERSMLLNSNKNKISASSTYFFPRDLTRTKPDKFPSDKHRQMQQTKWTGVHQHMWRTQSLLKTDLPFFSKRKSFVILLIFYWSVAFVNSIMISQQNIAKNF